MTDDPRALLRHYGLTPRKSLGQNFLVEPTAPARIAALAELTPSDTVIEVGAGLGTLTAALAARAGRVIAVETDPHLVSILPQALAAFDNVAIVHGDILDLDPAVLLDVPPAPVMPLWGTRLPHYHVVANLPYYITAAVMRHLLEATVRPARMVVTVQREVAARMVAVPDEMSVLAVSVQFYGQPRVGMRLKRGAFFPPPDVESAVVRVDLHDTPPVPVTDVAEFFRVVRAGFAQRRKQLRNTLAASLHLPAEDVVAALANVGVDATRRAETLTLAEWGRVTEALYPLP
ncbi:MAG TPA: 16S rRNA (adenine(1518)-N(6)/adenine(1519)-N(6))-dimethyltransferase RsmA [Anaerolineae bacterium]|mgnify:CR=1 FL=1|nr:16S rRNA (adenine(1518)-N(6)/adenine(1519)-N(6))-dimethyltransferase RsmA [Anaerolineae bacterium]HQI82988.1 16S rRNA (adenine(1518)-N(6)/adenine(1519)-N(6))-dimethyltransferase RsmA [Anaerolineae bacterium]